jgi:HAD superfamily hydrolase (TIGR01459 family)
VRIENSLNQFYNKYDLFLVDLWGVIHDGDELYDGVKNCLEVLQSQGKKVVFISNAPKRISLAQSGLKRLGITSDLYNGIVTSGEVTYDYITSGKNNLGSKYFLIYDKEVDLLGGSELTSVETPSEAYFVVAIGFKEPKSTLEELMPTICNCIDNKLLMICANPDLVVVDKNGIPALCAGVMAEKYIQMGGEVIYFGKPYHHIYERAFSLFPNIKKERICAIGDNMRTDIKGANSIGIDSYLIAGGIHAKELGIKHGKLPTIEKLNSFCDSYKTRPTGVLSGFVV